MYYVDVSKYQGTNMYPYKKLGAKGVIAQVTVGSSLKAPKCKAQLASAKKNGMHRLMYHYGCFGHSVKQAVVEGRFAAKTAKELGFKTIHIFCDWESQDNDTTGTVAQNTKAILAFMKTVRSYGFTVGLYSSASLFRTKIDIEKIIKKYGSCLWVASYPTMNPQTTANMRYFPSMDGVTMWQYTDNWHGNKVDCEKVVYDPFKLKKVQGTK